jgi:subtilisin family serine protease
MYLQGKKVCYKVSATKILVKSEKMNAESIKKTLTNTVVGDLRKIESLSDGVFLIEMQHTGKENMLKLQRQLSAGEDVLSVSPVFLDEYGDEAGGYTNRITVRLKSKNDYPVLQKYAGAYRITDIKPAEFDELKYRLTLPRNTQKNALEIANELYETGFFELASPVCVAFAKLGSNDTYFSKQWALNNPGQSIGTESHCTINNNVLEAKAGVDIKAEAAWGIITGSSSRRIAILDVGVDLDHPDLVNSFVRVNNVVLGFDASGNNMNGAPVNTIGDFPHGTKCAGVVAAQGNNSKGIIGVAYGCKILPATIGAIRIPTLLNPGNLDTDGSKIESGIDWARNNGADVISMSFSCAQYDEVVTALNTAATSGRGGKGCVLVACAQNQGNTSNPSVRFPASHDKVIAVGALLPNGQRKVESNYGPNLDVVAPGERIYTTGMDGATENCVINDGANGFYFPDFSATSAATPHVAGIAALILSVNSNLTAQEVRDIIGMTAQKLGGYVFQTTSAHPNGSWNNEVGYGLVDAQAAVQAATCTSSINPTISSNKFIRSCNNRFNIPTVI